jgi:hypothetical protein
MDDERTKTAETAAAATSERRRTVSWQAEDRRVPPDRVPVEPIDRIVGWATVFGCQLAGDERNLITRKPDILEHDVRQIIQRAARPEDKLAVARSCTGKMNNNIGHCGLRSWRIAWCVQFFGVPGWMRRSYSSASARSAAAPSPEKEGPCISASVRGDTFASARIVAPMPGLSAE